MKTLNSYTTSYSTLKRSSRVHAPCNTQLFSMPNHQSDTLRYTHLQYQRRNRLQLNFDAINKCIIWSWLCPELPWAETKAYKLRAVKASYHRSKQVSFSHFKIEWFSIHVQLLCRTKPECVSSELCFSLSSETLGPRWYQWADIFFLFWTTPAGTLTQNHLVLRANKQWFWWRNNVLSHTKEGILHSIFVFSR